MLRRMQFLFFKFKIFRFSQICIPGTFDIYAILRLWVINVDGNVVAGFYFDIESLDVVRDPLYIPQARIANGEITKLPPRAESRPHPYGK